MKATGIVRRVDDLGRVVIPKEIRRIIHVREGDPLEIYTNNEGCVMLRKYSYLDALNESKPVTQTIKKVTGIPCCIIDKCTVLEVAGPHRSDLISKHIDSSTLDILDSQRTWVSEESVPILNNIETYRTKHIFPIISEGEVIGAIVLFDGYDTVTEKDIAVCASMAQLMGIQSEI